MTRQNCGVVLAGKTNVKNFEKYFQSQSLRGCHVQ